MHVPLDMFWSILGTCTYHRVIFTNVPTYLLALQVHGPSFTTPIKSTKLVKMRKRLIYKIKATPSKASFENCGTFFVYYEHNSGPVYFLVITTL